MRILRIILAGLIGLAAMLATLFAAAVVVFTGLVAFVVQLFRRQAGPPPVRHQSQGMEKDGAIDVVATHVPSEPPKL